MVRKKDVQHIINKYADVLQRHLNIVKIDTIEYHIVSSTSKYSKKLKFPKDKNCGLAYISQKSAAIVLFYDQIRNVDEILATLLHELLHVKLSELTELITIKYEVGHRAEEDIIVDLEKFMMKNINFKKILK